MEVVAKVTVAAARVMAVAATAAVVRATAAAETAVAVGRECRWRCKSRQRMPQGMQRRVHRLAPESSHNRRLQCGS